MKKKIILVSAVLTSVLYCSAQQFLDKGMIEYQVTANVQKNMGSGFFDQMRMERLPKFIVSAYTLTFSDDKSIYKFDHWDAGMNSFVRNMSRGAESNIWYYDFNTNRCEIQKNIEGSNLGISDSIPAIQWKLVPNESREIAGFNCRKAQAILFDSVYVFAFYTEEITFPGGPAGFYGLPGTILGVTVPRLYTSWIATKVEVTGINESSIRSIGQKKALTYKALEKLLTERTNDWFSSSNPEENKELQREKQRFIWGNLL